MFEAGVVRSPSWSAARLGDLVCELGGVAGDDEPLAGGEELLALLGELERVKAAVAAAQARVTTAFAIGQERASAQAREAIKDQGFEAWQLARNSFRGSNGTAEQVGFARRLSPWQGSQSLSRSRALVEQLPRTLAALTAGMLSESRAALVVRETSHLSAADRALVDQEVCGELGVVALLGDRSLERAVRAAGYRCDPQGALDRARSAERERRVSIRPLPDATCRLSALLPLAQGVATYATLSRDADSARAAGDPRTRGQVIADTLVERVSGQAVASQVSVEVQVVISDAALFGIRDDPAQLPGYGSVPAGWVRDLVRGTERTATADTSDGVVDQARVWLRRLYATPDSTTLVAMESSRRFFDAGLRRFLIARDGTCRTPWCDAPIRHLDHVREHTAGGATAERNGQGLCERCNYTKRLSGWRVEVLDPSRPGHRVRWRTPTGATYESASPSLLPGARPRPDAYPDQASPMEAHLVHVLAA
ncbi:MAG: DUF222 domain-containing protein [Candidatus Nanopelagicales bacterium]